jgi:hypothetical protein
MDVGSFIGHAINDIITFCELYPIAAILFVAVVVGAWKLKG